LDQCCPVGDPPVPISAGLRPHEPLDTRGLRRASISVSSQGYKAGLTTSLRIRSVLVQLTFPLRGPPL